MFRAKARAGCRPCRRLCLIGVLISTRGTGFTRTTAGPGSPIILGANIHFTMAAGCGTFALGWAWVPGYNWGPAWVCWRHAEGEGYCGWAPLPPGARFEAGVGLMWNGRLAVDVDFGLAPDLFVFIPFDHFWARDYLAFRAPFWRVSSPVQGQHPGQSLRLCRRPVCV